MAAASREIIGREDELAGLERLLADSAHSSAALVLDGEAGIGKTTVWLEGLELASSRGLRVLAAPLDLAAGGARLGTHARSLPRSGRVQRPDPGSAPHGVHTSGTGGASRRLQPHQGRARMCVVGK
jgi:hypothetical protein